MAESDARDASSPPARSDASTEMAQLYQAFERGDYAQVRRGCKPLLRSKDTDLAEEARGLLARTRPDPLVRYLLLLTLALLVAVTVFAYSGGQL